MTIQNDFRTVTDRIILARHALAHNENAVLAARHNLTVAETDLETARSDAGSNDIARRAYAERETTDEREAVIDRRAELVRAEQDASTVAAALRIAEDDRRYLEFIARLAIAGVNDRPDPVAVYANGDGDEEFTF